MALLLAAGAFLILDGKPAFGGAALVAATAIKLTAGLALPFVLVASRHRWRVLAGAAAAAALSLAVGLAVFGPYLTNMIDVLRNHDQITSTITSVPGYIDHLLGGTGLTQNGRRLAQIGFGIGALVLLVYAWRKRNWLAGAGAALMLLVATLGWLLPWYAVWALPLAPLARKRWVPAGVLALTAVVLAIQIHIYDEHHSPAPGTRVGGAVIGVPGPRLP
jgi:alpha-1,6-mannosyltransferase